MLLIIRIHSISVTCYDSIYVILLLLPTYNIYKDLTVFVFLVAQIIILLVSIQG